jgi:hypothetical protein
MLSYTEPSCHDAGMSMRRKLQRNAYTHKRDLAEIRVPRYPYIMGAPTQTGVR